MVEIAYVLIKIDENTKEMVVEQRSFAYGSDEAKETKQKEIEFLNKAKKYGYKIVCDGEVICDYVKKKAESQKTSTENEDRVGKLAKIMSKDITALTEEEIVLLAQSRVNNSSKTYVGDEGAYEKLNDIISEYQRIKGDIEQKNSGNRTFH